MSRLLMLCLAPAALAAAGACVADNGDEGMYLSKAVAPGEECSFTSDESEPFLPHGRISIFSPIPYRMIPQVKSKVVAEEGRIEARTIQIRGARVNLEFADETIGVGIDERYTKFSSLYAAPLEPNGGIVDGIFDLVPEGLLRSLADAHASDEFEAEIIAKVRVYGDMNGSDVETQEFIFPVTVCNNCVINNLGACPVAPVNPGNACNPYQDGVVDCCMQGTDMVCPSKAPTGMQN